MRTGRPWYLAVTHRAGIRTRSRTFAHRSASTTRANDTVLTDGSRILNVHVSIGEVAGAPLAVRGLPWHVKEL